MIRTSLCTGDFFSFLLMALKKYDGGEREIKVNKTESVVVNFNYKLNRCVTYGNVDSYHNVFVMCFVTVFVGSENATSKSRKKVIYL